jgi:hypothetical protein
VEGREKKAIETKYSSQHCMQVSPLSHHHETPNTTEAATSPSSYPSPWASLDLCHSHFTSPLALFSFFSAIKFSNLSVDLSHTLVTDEGILAIVNACGDRLEKIHFKVFFSVFFHDFRDF